MKNKGILLCLILIILILCVQFAIAAPPWKKTSTTPTAPSTPSSPTSPTTTQTKVIIINNTQSAAPAAAPWYNDWNFIGVAIVVVAALVGWIISRKIRGKTAKYMSEIDGVYRSYSKNANKCEAELANIREKIEGDFKKGKINDQGLAILDARIEKYSEKLRGEIIDKGFKLPPDLNKKIKNMLSDGVITKDEYEHFLDVLKKGSGLSKQDEARLKLLMKKWETEDKK